MKPEFFREDWARLCYPKTAIFEPRPFDTSWAASIRQANDHQSVVSQRSSEERELIGLEIRC